MARVSSFPDLVPLLSPLLKSTLRARLILTRVTTSYVSQYSWWAKTSSAVSSLRQVSRITEALKSDLWSSKERLESFLWSRSTISRLACSAGKRKTSVAGAASKCSATCQTSSDVASLSVSSCPLLAELLRAAASPLSTSSKIWWSRPVATQPSSSTWETCLAQATLSST